VYNSATAFAAISYGELSENLENDDLSVVRLKNQLIIDGLPHC